MTEPLVLAENLQVLFPVKMNVLQVAGRAVLRQVMRARGHAAEELERPVVHAVDGVSFEIRPGEILGLVGESGCGKTTTGRAVLRLVEPTAGRVMFEGRDITSLKESELRALRPRMQLIFQDPHAAMNPTMTIGQSIQDPLLIHEHLEEAEAKERTLQVMEEVGLTPAADLFDKYPSDVSGGQKQRAVIARAIILRPSLIVADEPVAMLDMSVRARILELLLDLKRTHGLTYLLITHDLATAKFMCDRIAIMYLGRIVETGPARAIYTDPKHPYTRALIAAIPVPDPGHPRTVTLPRGEVPDAIRPPGGCRFHPRCPAAMPTCGWEGRDFVDFLEQASSAEGWTYEGNTARRDLEGENAKDLIARTDAALARAPEPLRDAVDGVAVEDGAVVVRFRPQDTLRSQSVDDRTVECLLY